MLFMCLAAGIYGYAFFMVVILQGMGYSAGRVFLLSAPPALASVPFSLIISYLADRTKMRAPYVAFMAIVCTVGYVLVAYPKQNGVRYVLCSISKIQLWPGIQFSNPFTPSLYRYFGCFLGIAGANGCLPAVLAWQANNIRGQSTRAYVQFLFHSRTMFIKI